MAIQILLRFGTYTISVRTDVTSVQDRDISLSAEDFLGGHDLRMFPPLSNAMPTLRLATLVDALSGLLAPYSASSDSHDRVIQ